MKTIILLTYPGQWTVVGIRLSTAPAPRGGGAYRYPLPFPGNDTRHGPVYRAYLRACT